jgi:hypothetical protein
MEPLVLREVKGGCKLVGVCYVHGVAFDGSLDSVTTYETCVENFRLYKILKNAAMLWD